jgi:dTDP-4-dehydrorhamnose reductase
MKQVIVLGSTGMLGRAVSKISPHECSVIEVNRASKPVETKNSHFRIANSISEIEEIFKTGDVAYLINCAGLIRQKMDLEYPGTIKSALDSNVVIPLKLAELSDKYGFDVIQIGTDCVFSGNKGNYTEIDKHDPNDLYGRTKSLGEIPHPRLTIIRASIIGIEEGANKSLLSWLLSHPANAEIEGYLDQQWNGITVLHFAKLVEGIINSGNSDDIKGTHHFVPSDSVSKLELLRIIARAFDRDDLIIRPVESKRPADMTLSTVNIAFNESLWNTAGYRSTPTVEEMILEYSKFMTAKSRR